MKITLTVGTERFTADLENGTDLSIPVGPNGPRAWYVGPPSIAPVINRQFTGSVALGGSVNFYNISFNPHGHGTHTESLGHIARGHASVNDCLTRHFFVAQLLTLRPEAQQDGDRVITEMQLADRLLPGAEALLLRTLPNLPEKTTKDYSNTNFPYIHHTAMARIVQHGIRHLLVDLPSVDREEDGGRLLAHHVFWGFPDALRTDATITEFIYAPDTLEDGLYLLNLQVAPFVNDAAPSRPVVYSLQRATER
jgi:arylformamidase